MLSWPPNSERLRPWALNEDMLKTFSEMKLGAPILKALAKMGFENPTPIQEQTLPLLLEGPTDLLGLAATGTGKTAAFGLPLIEHLNLKQRGHQALILCPTRELALQVEGQIQQLGQFKGVKTICLYGGTGYKEQIQGLRSGAPIVVGTPGRVLDHLRRGTLKLNGLKTLILDEADEMISMGFREDLEEVISVINRDEANIWLFSATMGPDVRHLVDRYLVNYKEIKTNKKQMLSQTINQTFCIVRESDRASVLCKFIENADGFYGIVFCQTKVQVMDLTTYLIARGYKADCLHGDKNQKDRERAMQAFRDKKISILVCTDVAARGLDVKEVSHVINYSVPRELDSYVHRIGRTARSGAYGEAISFISPKGRGLIRRLENITKSKIDERRVPTMKEIGRRKVLNSLNSFTEEAHYQRAMAHLSDEWKETLSKMPPEEIAGRFLAMMQPSVFSSSVKL